MGFISFVNTLGAVFSPNGRPCFSIGKTGTFVRTRVRGQRDMHLLGLCMS